MKNKKLSVFLIALVVAIWGTVAYSLLQNVAPHDTFVDSAITSNTTNAILPTRQPFDPQAPDPFALPERLLVSKIKEVVKQKPPAPVKKNEIVLPINLPELVGVSGKLALFLGPDTTITFFQSGDSIAGYTVQYVAREAVHLRRADSDTTLYVDQIPLTLNQ